MRSDPMTVLAATEKRLDQAMETIADLREQIKEHEKLGEERLIFISLFCETHYEEIGADAEEEAEEQPCPYCEIDRLRAENERLMEEVESGGAVLSQVEHLEIVAAGKDEEITRLRAKLEAAESHRDGLYRVMRALAEDDRPRLATVDERIQANVDAVVVKRIELETKVERLEGVVEAARKLQAWVYGLPYLGSKDDRDDVNAFDEALAALDAVPAAARLAETEQQQWDRVHWGGEKP